MPRRKGSTVIRTSAIIAIIFILGLAALGAYTVLAGRPIYTADDVDSVVAYDSSGSSVTVSDLSTRGGDLEFTLASAAAKLVITMENDVKDFEGINQINIDLSGMELGGYDRVRVKLSDGTTTVTLGGYDEDVTYLQVPIEDDDWDQLDEYSQVKLYIEFYNSSGGLTDVIKADTHTLVVDWVIAGGTSSFTAVSYTHLTLPTN